MEDSESEGARALPSPCHEPGSKHRRKAELALEKVVAEGLMSTFHASHDPKNTLRLAERCHPICLTLTRAKTRITRSRDVGPMIAGLE